MEIHGLLPKSCFKIASQLTHKVAIKLRQRKSQSKTLTNGPGKLSQAMAIDRDLNGEDLIDSQAIWFEMGTPLADEEVALSGRIGIDFADAEAREKLWRFFEKGNKWVSK